MYRYPVSQLARRSPRLSAREIDVLRRTAEGASARLIGRELGISAKTVETYRTRGYQKLGLRRLSLVRYAVQAGWFALVVLAAPLQAQRTYWPVSVDSLAIGHTNRTHVAVRGVVAYVGHEDDQDMHVRLVSLSGSGKYVIAECAPTLPCRLPSGVPWVPLVGDTVTVYGISRRDPEHGWWECHPVEGVLP